MKPVSIDSPEFLAASKKPSVLDTLARRAVRLRLESLQIGQIVLSEGGSHESFGALTDELPLTAQITVHDPRFYSEVAFGGGRQRMPKTASTETRSLLVSLHARDLVRLNGECVCLGLLPTGTGTTVL